MQTLYNTKNGNYVVDIKPEHNVTVVRMLDCRDIVEDACHKINTSSLMLLGMLTNVHEMVDPNNPEVKAIARCSKEDTFDGDIGTEIAVSRAERKYYKKRSMEYRRYAELFEKAAKDMRNMSDINKKKAEGQKRSEEYLISLVEKLQ